MGNLVGARMLITMLAEQTVPGTPG